MKTQLQRRFEAGFYFTYTVPGLQKVVQAAGRVIRSERDRGYVWLLDDRFCQPALRHLLPHWWALDVVV